MLVTIPLIVNGKNLVEVAKDGASKGIPMKWTIYYPGDRASLYTRIGWNSIMGSCGRTEFVGSSSKSLPQAVIGNARIHVRRAFEALGSETGQP